MEVDNPTLKRIMGNLQRQYQADLAARDREIAELRAATSSAASQTTSATLPSPPPTPMSTRAPTIAAPTATPEPQHVTLPFIPIPMPAPSPRPAIRDIIRQELARHDERFRPRNFGHTRSEHEQPQAWPRWQSWSHRNFEASPDVRGWQHEQTVEPDPVPELEQMIQDRTTIPSAPEFRERVPAVGLTTDEQHVRTRILHKLESHQLDLRDLKTLRDMMTKTRPPKRLTARPLGRPGRLDARSEPVDLTHPDVSPTVLSAPTVIEPTMLALPRPGGRRRSVTPPRRPRSRSRSPVHPISPTASDTTVVSTGPAPVAPITINVNPSPPPPPKPTRKAKERPIPPEHVPRGPRTVTKLPRIPTPPPNLPTKRRLGARPKEDDTESLFEEPGPGAETTQPPAIEDVYSDDDTASTLTAGDDDYDFVDAEEDLE